MAMVNLSFDAKKELKLVALGAHCDDIEIGCGGAILKLINDYNVTEIKWIVFASNEQRKKEAITGAKKFLDGLKNVEITVLDYNDAYLSQSAYEIKDFFEALKKQISPDVIFTHYRDDRHQDHRLISDLTWNTFRDHFILEYEIPKYDGDLGQPNFFIALNEEIAAKKVKYVMESYESQSKKHWFDEETFYSLLRLRGIESANINKYSEAFYARKTVF